MNEEERKEVEEFQEFYESLQDSLDDKQIGEIMSVFAYILAEILVDHKIPRNEFLAHYMEEFDSAYEYLTRPKPKEH